MSQAQTEIIRRIPSQPEVNIGTSGHVDHGKCERIDQYVLLDGVPVTGYEIFKKIQAHGVLLNRVDGGEVYSFEGNQVISINGKLEPVKAESFFYVQKYVGKMYTIRASSGRSICVTPEHPLLVNRNGIISWIKAKEIRQNDDLAFLSTVPLEETFNLDDPTAKLKEIYQVVTGTDFERINSLTCGFSDFSALSVDDFERTRIIVGISKSQLMSIAKISPSKYSRILTKMESPNAEFRGRLIALLKTGKPQTLEKNEFLVENKSRPRRIYKLVKIPSIDDDIAKWFAFVWAEGSSTKNFVEVTQTIQERMLTDFLRITKEKFGIDTKKCQVAHYRIYNTAFVDYLHLGFDYNPGNEQVCGISNWVCKLPKTLKALFLRWFLTLDGEFDVHSGQISVTQLNEKNIVLLAYLLHSFGIVPKFSSKRVQTKKGIREYKRIQISGRKSLELFARHIGFEDGAIQERLLHYLSKIKKESKETNLSIPIDMEALRVLFRNIGLVREGFKINDRIVRMKKSPWYKAYEMGMNSGRMSRPKLLEVLASCEAQIKLVEQSASRIVSDGAILRSHMELVALSLEAVSSQLGYSRKKLMRILREGTKDELGSISNFLKTETKRLLLVSNGMLEQLRILLSSSLEFDRILIVDQEQYDGLVFDLTVPTQANFIAGNGAIVCHNTTLVQAITGIWTSAHSEELRRGITIKVGYADAAFYKCPNSSPPSCYITEPNCEKFGGGEASLLRVVSFVDCPGHESLMANMLSGAALMDGSVLVIASNEKVPQPQTREHLLALQMMGMKKIVIVQNKVDLITDEEASENYKAIKNFVAGSVAADAPIIPVSAQHRLNIDALIEAIEENIPTPKRDQTAPPLMYVLRSFDVNHPGLDESRLVGGVLGGTLIQGKLAEGDEIELRPGIIEEGKTEAQPIVTKVTSVMTSAGGSKQANPGGLIAVGTELDPYFTRSDLLVGSVLGKPGNLPPVFESLSMETKLFETAVGTQELVKVDKIRMSEILRLNVGTGVTVGIVSSVRDLIVDCKLKKPICAAKGSRIAISRRIGDRWRLIGAGTVR
jgi:translation initiation factor 2 subunit 3